MECDNPDCCKDMPHTMEVKVCRSCGDAIDGWNCTLCDRCSRKLGECGHCRTPLP